MDIQDRIIQIHAEIDEITSRLDCYSINPKRQDYNLHKIIAIMTRKIRYLNNVINNELELQLFENLLNSYNSILNRILYLQKSYYTYEYLYMKLYSSRKVKVENPLLLLNNEIKIIWHLFLKYYPKKSLSQSKIDCKKLLQLLKSTLECLKDRNIKFNNVLIEITVKLLSLILRT